MNRWLDDLFIIDRAPATLAMHRTYLLKFARDTGTGQRHPSRIGKAMIDEWVNPPGPIKVKARRCRLSSLRQFYKWCVESKHVTTDPTVGVRVRLRNLSLEQKEPAERAMFTDEMVARVLAHCRDRIVPNHSESWRFKFWFIAVSIGRYTGLRISDVCLMEQASLTRRPGKLTIWMRKTQCRVILPLDAPPLAEAVGMIQSTDPRYCFPVWRERYLTSRTTINHQFSAILKSVGISGVSFHSLRRAYAYAAWRAGRRTPHIRESMGHASEAMTERYIQEEEV